MLSWVLFWFILSVVLKRNDIVDIAWGLGFIYFSIWVALSTDQGMSQYIVFGLVFLWGLRLSVYLLMRIIRKPEDYRYLNWRNEWGRSFLVRSFFQVYVLQNFLLLLIAIPLVIISLNAQNEPNLPAMIPGLSLWGYGFFWQTTADYQLFQFKKDLANKGKIIQIGLWRRSRHPNYYGELCMWWGVWLCILPYSYGWLGIISPILISWLIIKVSGIPMLEAKYEGNKQFEDYQKRVPVLIPKLKLLSKLRH